MTKELRQDLVAAAQAMNRSGINQGTSGNLSLRCVDGFLVTPSGLPYDRLEPADVVQLKLERGDAPAATGPRKPSSEWRIHRDVYLARPETQAILHAHPVHCSALACLRRPLPAFHYMVAVAGGRDIRCAPYATFGSQALSDHVLEALAGRQACLMANHGLLCLAPDLPRALALAVEIEALARAYLLCLSVGEPVVLDDAEMERVLEKFKDYGA
ncbi:MAG: class II aldolase/adducin family protein [Lysobacterales bacterium]